MKILSNKKYLALLCAVLLLLGGCIYFLALSPSRDIPKEKGMADLILDSEVDSSSPGKEDFSLAEEETGSQGSASQDASKDPSPGTSSDSSASEDGAQNSSGASEGTGEDSEGEPQPPASGEGEEAAPDEDEKPAESTNRHPYELPLVPVKAS